MLIKCATIIIGFRYMNTKMWITCESIYQMMDSRGTNEISVGENSSSVALMIHFDPLETWVIVPHFFLAIIANTVLALSVILSTRHHHNNNRTGNKMPIIDLILLILSISTIIRILIRSGLMLLCIYGEFFSNFNFIYY